MGYTTCTTSQPDRWRWPGIEFLIRQVSRLGKMVRGLGVRVGSGCIVSGGFSPISCIVWQIFNLNVIDYWEVLSIKMLNVYQIAILGKY